MLLSWFFKFYFLGRGGMGSREGLGLNRSEAEEIIVSKNKTLKLEIHWRNVCL